MKIFNIKNKMALAQYENTIMLIPNKDKTIAYQMGADGLYKETLDITLTKKVLLDVTQFKNALDIVDNKTFKVQENKNGIILKDEKNKVEIIALNMEGTFNENELADINNIEGFVPMDVDFTDKFKQASEFTDRNGGIAQSGVFKVGNFLYGTNTAVIVKVPVPQLKDFDNVVFKNSTFETFENPTKMKITKTHLYMANEDFSKVAKVRLLETPIPNVEKVFDNANKGSGEPISWDFSELFDATTNAMKMGNKKIDISKNLATSNDQNISSYESNIDINIEDGVKIKFQIESLRKFINSGQLFIVKSMQNAFYLVTDDGLEAIILPMRG